MSPDDLPATGSTQTPLRVLLVEDSEADAELLLRELQRGGYAPQWDRVHTAPTLTAALTGRQWDVIICDAAPQLGTPAALQLIREDSPDIPVIIVSGQTGEEAAAQAMRAGAHDYVSKEKLTRLSSAVERELRLAEARRSRQERERDDALKQAQELEQLRRADHFKSEYVGFLAHELRNPLNVIMGSIELLVEGAFGDLTGEQIEQLQRAAGCADEMVQLLKAALDLTRAESGDVALRLGEVDVVELLRELDAETLQLRQRQEVAFVWHAASDLPHISTDPVKLKVVLKNLVGNGLKFTEQGSVMLDAHLRDGGIEFSVADTGVGIVPEALPIIFEAFRQVEASKAQRRGGVGLGLYIARRFVEVLGGRITVDSRVGLGSIFKVWLPTPRATWSAVKTAAESFLP